MTTGRPPRKQGKTSGGLSDRSANILIAVVTTVWVANIAAGMVKLNGYQSDQAVNGIFMVIVGGAFALRGKGKDDA